MKIIRSKALKIEPFKCLLIDPPWRYQNWTDAKQGAAHSAMETMETRDIADIPVEGMIADDCLIGLWATMPKLIDAFHCAEQWGLLPLDLGDALETSINKKENKYLSAIPWIKTVPNTGNIHLGVGFWTMGCSELLLLFKCGKVKKAKTPPVYGLLTGPKTNPIFWSQKGKQHSQKPDELHSWLERIVPGPYGELFARRKRHGWGCYGLDTGFKLDHRGITEV